MNPRYGESFPILYQTTEKIKIYSLEKYICAPRKDILSFLYATLPLGQETSDNATSIICVKLVSLSMAEVASPVTKNEELEKLYLIGENPIVDYKGKEVHLNRLKLAKRDGKGSKVRL